LTALCRGGYRRRHRGRAGRGHRRTRAGRPPRPPRRAARADGGPRCGYVVVSVPGVEIETVRVELGARSYDILVGPNLLAQAGTHVRPRLRRPRAVVVTDTNLA